VATLLSFAWPGLGQAYRRRRRAAVGFAVLPTLVLGSVALLGLVLGLPVFAVYLLNPFYSALAGLAVVALAVWWAAAILDAGRPHTRASTLTAIVLVALVALAYGWAGAVVWSLYQAGVRISQPIAEVTPTPVPTGPSSPAPTVSGQPTAPPVDPPARVTILFVGRDSGSGPDSGRTDTLQVASLDTRSGELVMISVPRDTGQMPLYNGGTWDQKINALMSAAQRQPERFPDGGIGTLVRQIEYIVGIPIDYYATIDFRGFVRLVDMVGGVDVVLDRPIRDATYWHDPQTRGFFMEPGEHHLDGATALAYVRSRHGPGNSDFQRARRQQQVLLALRDKIDDPGVLANLPAIIDAASAMVRSDVSLNRLPEIVGLLQTSADAEVDTYVLQPRKYAEVVPRSEIGNVYMIRLKMDAVAELSIELFGDESRYAQEQGPSPRPSE